MGGSRSGGSEDREEKKIPTYADQLKKGVNISHGPQGSGRYKLTDKGLEKSPTFLEKTLTGQVLTGFKDSEFNKKNTIGLRKNFFEGKKRTLDKGKIIVTTPVGEEHCIPCNLIESLLLSKGFTTFNLSPSTPADSLIEFIKTIHPTAVLISITLNDNIKAGQRLAKKINEHYKKLPVYVGGQALSDSKSKFQATIISHENTLEQIPKILTQRKK